MTGTRGPKSKPLPKHPNRVLVEARKTGLSTAVYLQRAVANSNGTHLYESSRDILSRYKEAYYLSNALGRPDFDWVLKAEHNIGKNGLAILAERAAAYGCTETVRAKRWYEDVGPWNQRLNAGGAALRECGVLDYPTGKAQDFVDEEGELSGYGYPGDSRTPCYKPVHKMLPELDFVDACRMHMQVLNTECYIHDVPVRDTRRYSNLFLLHARPYLDRMYTEHAYGKQGFRNGTVKVLSEIKADIRKHFHVRSGEEQTVSSHFTAPEPTFSMTFFKQQLEEAREAGVLNAATNELERIMEGGSQVEKDEEGNPAPCLTAADVQHIWEKASDRAKRIGSIIHDRITSLFDKFYRVTRAIYEDDRDQADEPYRIVAELPLNTDKGRGRADIVVFRREAAPTGLRCLWRPLMVIEIKTHSGFNWYLGSETRPSNSRERRGQVLRTVPTFSIKTRPLGNSEWKRISEATPSNQTKGQLNVYAKALSKAFGKAACLEDPPDVVQATLIIDPSVDSANTRAMVKPLILESLETLLETHRGVERKIFEAKSEHHIPRMGLVVHEQSGAIGYEGTPIPQEWQPPYDPLYGSEFNSRRFILYVSSRSPTSSGKSAARIASYYHGMKVIHQLCEDRPETEIVWLDLIDSFTSSPFAKRRLRVRCHDEYFDQQETIQDTIKKINFEGLFKTVHRAIFEGAQPSEIEIPIDRDRSTPRLVVVSGWNGLREATPSVYRKRLDLLLSRILKRIPDEENTTILWFTSAVTYAQRAVPYSTNCILPFYDDSLLKGAITDIVWNLPCAPRMALDPKCWGLRNIAKAPMYDDIRIIINQNSAGFGINLTHIPPLLRWSAKFRTEEYDKGTIEPSSSAQEAVPDLDMRKRMKTLALTLLPWLADLWPRTILPFKGKKQLVGEVLNSINEENSGRSSDFSIISRDVPYMSRSRLSLLDRFKFRCPPSRNGQSYVEMTTKRINAQRMYRSTQSTKTEERMSDESASPRTAEDEEKVLFGQVLEPTTPDTPYSLIAVNDPRKPSRLLVGVFRIRHRMASSPDLWALTDVSSYVETLHEMVNNAPRRNLVFRSINECTHGWQSDYEGANWQYLGIVDFIRGGQVGLMGVLRGLRIESAEVSKPSIPEGDVIPDGFSEDVSIAFGTLLSMVEQCSDVQLRLNWDDDVCTVSFLDSDEVVASVDHTSTAALTNTLRLSRHGLPVKIDAEHALFWNRFTDIDYGELSLAAIVAETYIPMDSSIRLPATLSMLTSLPDNSPVTVTIEHDQELCPIAQGNGHNHGHCWRIDSDNANKPLQDILDGALNDRQILLTLGPKKMIVGENQYPLELEVKGSLQKYPQMVLRESPLIAKVLAQSGYRSRTLLPGTYLRSAHHKWNIEFSLLEAYPAWSAHSNLTGEKWKNTSYTIELDYTNHLSDEVERILDSITTEIPLTEIEEPELLRARLRRYLKALGFTDDKIKVELLVSRNGETFTETVRRAQGDKRTFYTYSYTVSKDTHRQSFMEGIEEDIDYGDVSEFEIVNIEEYLEKLGRLLDELGI
ncbi:MAG: hypothetical protein R6V83_06195 [Candidatus Thorarchaeota archaeon]